MRHDNAFAIALVCLTATGCAGSFTPDTLMSEGRYHDAIATQAPAAAAGCIARNIENARDIYAASVRALPETGQEISVRAPAAKLGGVYALMHVLPAAQGSRVRMWLQPGFSTDVGDEFFLAQIRRC